MAALKLLILHTPTECMVQINGSAAGETENGLITLTLFSGRFMLSLIPIENDETHIYLPLYRMIDLREIPKNSPELTFYHFGSDTLYLEAKPPHINRDSTPYIIASREIRNRQANACLYYDRGTNFIIEDNLRRILFSYPLPILPQEAEIQTHHFSGLQLLSCHIKTEEQEYLLLLSLSGEYQALFFGKILRFEIEQTNFCVYEDIRDPMGMCICRRFYPINGSFREESTEYTSHIFKERTLAALSESLLLSVQHRAESYAMSLLSPSLRNDIDFSALCSFFGQFDRIIDLFSGETGAHLIYLLYEEEKVIRRFRFRGYDMIEDIDED